MIRPVQFFLRSLPKTSSLTQELGAGWEGINENKCFNTDELQKEVEMTTSEDYEKAYIQLMTMRLITVVQTKLNGRLFSIQCKTEPFEVENNTIQARHPKMFKNGTYEFHPHNELVMSMPFEFIDGLKENDWTAIDKIWSCTINHHQADQVHKAFWKRLFLQPIN